MRSGRESCPKLWRCWGGTSPLTSGSSRQCWRLKGFASSATELGQISSPISKRKELPRAEAHEQPFAGDLDRDEAQPDRMLNQFSAGFSAERFHDLVLVPLRSSR